MSKKQPDPSDADNERIFEPILLFTNIVRGLHHGDLQAALSAKRDLREIWGYDVLLPSLTTEGKQKR